MFAAFKRGWPKSKHRCKSGHSPRHSSDSLQRSILKREINSQMRLRLFLALILQSFSTKLVGGADPRQWSARVSSLVLRCPGNHYPNCLSSLVLLCSCLHPFPSPRRPSEKLLVLYSCCVVSSIDKIGETAHHGLILLRPCYLLPVEQQRTCLH
jgi:hypothetical protein